MELNQQAGYIVLDYNVNKYYYTSYEFIIDYNIDMTNICIHKSTGPERVNQIILPSNIKNSKREFVIGMCLSVPETRILHDECMYQDAYM